MDDGDIIVEEKSQSEILTSLMTSMVSKTGVSELDWEDPECINLLF